MDRVTAMSMKGRFFLCPECFDIEDFCKDGKIIISPDDTHCQHCGWKVDLDQCHKGGFIAEAEHLEEDDLLELAFVPEDSDLMDEFSEDELMRMPLGDSEAELYLEKLREKHLHDNN